MRDAEREEVRYNSEFRVPNYLQCGMWCNGCTRLCDSRGEGFDSPLTAIGIRS